MSFHLVHNLKKTFTGSSCYHMVCYIVHEYGNKITNKTVFVFLGFRYTEYIKVLLLLQN